jgi:hypothetical protein
LAGREPLGLPGDDRQRQGGQSLTPPLPDAHHTRHLADFWLVLGIAGGVKRRIVTIDEYGNVVDQKV